MGKHINSKDIKKKMNYLNYSWEILNSVNAISSVRILNYSSITVVAILKGKTSIIGLFAVGKGSISSFPSLTPMRS